MALITVLNNEGAVVRGGPVLLRNSRIMSYSELCIEKHAVRENCNFSQLS